MGDGDNVLWELCPEKPSDVAYHSGADVGMLSQFAQEEEVLFPPLTMLVAKKVEVHKLPHVGPRVSRPSLMNIVGDVDVREDASEEKKLIAIKVIPNFQQLRVSE